MGRVTNVISFVESICSHVAEIPDSALARRKHSFKVKISIIIH